MRYSPIVAILRRCFAANYLLAFAFSVIFAGAATLISYMSNSRLPPELKATPETHAAIAGAKKEHSKNAVGKKHAELRARRDKVHVEKEEFQAGEADDPDARLNWFWFQRMYPFDDIPAGARRRAWESLPLRGKAAGFRATLDARPLLDQHRQRPHFPTTEGLRPDESMQLQSRLLILR